MSELPLHIVAEPLAPDVLDALVDWASVDRAVSLTCHLADTSSPTQTPSWTLGPIIAQYLADWGVEEGAWEPNFGGTGNGVLRIGAAEHPRLWIVAHWDKISFLIGPKDQRGYELTPFHAHMLMHGSVPGRVLRFDLGAGAYQTVSEGTIIGGETPRYLADDAAVLESGDRAVYHTPAERVGVDRYTAQIDNAAGCAGVLMAAGFMASILGLEALVVFADEEEGPVALGNTAFSRGLQRLLYRLPPPDVAISVEQHALDGDIADPRLGAGAMIRESASATRGAVTPPWLYATVRDVTGRYPPHVTVQENLAGHLNRSDCVPLMHATANVIHCGPPTLGRHYRDGPYVFTGHDVAHLARSLVVLTHHIRPLADTTRSLK